MSNIFYGFYTIHNFVNNSPDAVNVIGELGPKPSTYSRDIKNFANAEGVFNLFSTDELDTFVQDRISLVGDTTSGLLDGLSNYTENSISLLDDMERFFGENVLSVTIGPGILNLIDNKIYPAWIQFTKDIGTTEIHVVTVKVWLSNLRFRDEYPNGEFNLIYPITDIQTLYNNYSICKTQVANLSPSFFTTKLTQTLSGVVLTGTTVFNVTVHNRLNDVETFEFPILVAYNGNNVYCNEQNYIARLIEELLEPELHTLEEWNSVIRISLAINEYYIIPKWNNTAISNSSLAFPIYSPTIDKSDVDFQDIANTYFPEFSLAEVENFINYFVSVYKSIGLYIVPGLNNPDGRIPFSEKFNDYFIIRVNDPNVEQMSLPTRQFTVLLNSLLIEAEKYEIGSTLTGGISMLTREEKIYLTKINGNVKINILTKMSMGG